MLFHRIRTKRGYMTNEIKPVDLSDPSIKKIIEALKSGKKLEAIMIYRSTHNVSIAESKQIVEEMEAKLGL
jgi:hypothetical protein